MQQSPGKQQSPVIQPEELAILREVVNAIAEFDVDRIRKMPRVDLPKNHEGLPSFWERLGQHSKNFDPSIDDIKNDIDVVCFSDGRGLGITVPLRWDSEEVLLNFELLRNVSPSRVAISYFSY